MSLCEDNNNSINIAPHLHLPLQYENDVFRLKGKILILHALQFLAHFNYANCVYVETNSHCLHM